MNCWSRNPSDTRVLCTTCYANTCRPQRACKLNKAKGKSIAQFGKINCFHPNSSTKTQIFQSVWTISASRPKNSVPHETLFKTWPELWSTKMLQNTARQIKKYPRLKSSAELSSNNHIMPNSCVRKYSFPLTSQITLTSNFASRTFPELHLSLAFLCFPLSFAMMLFRSSLLFKTDSSKRENIFWKIKRSASRGTYAWGVHDNRSSAKP